MTTVRVAHRTEYRYRRPVILTQHRLMLRPRDSHDLRLRAATLAVTPWPARTRWAHDVFGNSVCYLDWKPAPTTLLRIVSKLHLDHYPSAVDLPLEPSAELYPFSYAAGEAPDLAHLLRVDHPDPDVAAWALGFVQPGGETGTMDMLTAMTQAIRSGFVYEARHEAGTYPAGVTLRGRRGTCRDFAMLMMEAVRTLGLAAQFVSGYLYDDCRSGADPVVGGGATHAWCSVYLPGAGWVEFDPTNGLVAGRNLIRVCSARAPEQAVPVGGGYEGNADDFVGLEVSVDVAVGEPAQGVTTAG